MSEFAEVLNGIVQRVIVAHEDFINSGRVGDPANWVQHKDDADVIVRKNGAGIGYEYDKALDAFIPPKQYASWVLDKAKAQYVAPVKMPVDGKMHTWDELAQAWADAKA